MAVVGIVSPGAMGSAVGRCYLKGGARVVAAREGRSARSLTLATAAGIELVDSLGEVVVADLVVSVVPPGQALQVGRDLAEALAGTGARPLVLDANAVSPQTVAALARLLPTLVDGSISGGPPAPGDDPCTRLYLSGPRAAEVAAVPAPGLDVRVVGPDLGTASALKMCTAAFYKGRTALAAQVMLTAHAHGLTDLVLDDLGDLLPTARSTGLAVAKAWRYVGEMQEISSTQGAAGMPPELYAAMARVYAVLAERAGPRDPEDVPADLTWADLLGPLGQV